MTKKFLSMFLALAMCLSLAAPAGAMEDATAWSDRCTDNARVFTPQEFAQLFSTDELATRSSNRVDSISYSYRMTKKPENSLFADVEMHITLNGQYPITVLGTVNGYLLSNNDILWEGPLDGTVTINNISYSVIVGFAKLESDNKIQASMTIQAVDPASEIGLIIFTFGDTVVTKEIYQEIKDTESVFQVLNIDGAGEDLNRSIEAYSDEYETILNSFEPANAEFNKGSYSVSGYSQTVRAYFSSNNRFAVAIQSYSSNVDDYFTSLLGTGFLVDTSVRSISVQLERRGDANSYIAAIESYGIGNSNGSSVSLYPLFKEFASFMKVPMSTLEQIYNTYKNVTGVTKETRTANGNYAEFSASFSIYQENSFDKYKGFSMVFQLANNPVDGPTTYSYTTIIRYHTALLEGDGTMNIAYVDGNSVSKTVSITTR